MQLSGPEGHGPACRKAIVIVPNGHIRHNIPLISFDLPCHLGTPTIHITGSMKAAQIT